MRTLTDPGTGIAWARVNPLVELTATRSRHVITLCDSVGEMRIRDLLASVAGRLTLSRAEGA